MLLLTSMQSHESGITMVLFSDHTTNSERKVLRNIIFLVRDESTKTAKIMRLKKIQYVQLWWCAGQLQTWQKSLLTDFAQENLCIYQPRLRSWTLIKQLKGSVYHDDSRPGYLCHIEWRNEMFAFVLVQICAILSLTPDTTSHRMSNVKISNQECVLS